MMKQNLGRGKQKLNKVLRADLNFPVCLTKRKMFLETKNAYDNYWTIMKTICRI